MDTIAKLRRENEELRRQLNEAEGAVRALREGRVDAIVVDGARGPQVISLAGEETVYRLAFETMLEGVVNVVPDGRILFCNQRFAEFVAAPLEQVTGRDLADFVPPDDVDKLRALLRRCTRGPVRQRVVLRAADGNLRSIHLTGNALTRAGEVSLCLVASDLTEIESSGQQISLLREQQRALEEADRALEKARDKAISEKNLLEAVMEALPVGLCIVDARGGNVRNNSAYDTIWGGPRPTPQAIGEYAAYRAWWLDTGQPVLPGEWASARAVERGETVIAQLLRIERFDGTQAFVHNSAAPIFDARRRIIGGAVAIMDITRQIETQEALRETRDYLQNLIDYANAPIIVWDPAFRITRFNHAFELLTGRSAQEVLGQRLDILFPAESRNATFLLLQRTQSGERWDTVEIPILRLDGTVRTVLWNSASLYAEDGKTLTATIAQGQDVTDRRLAEKEKTLHLQNLEFLAQSALRFLKQSGSEQVFEYTARQISGLLAHGLVFVAQYDAAEKCRIVRAFGGDQNALRRISAALGRDLIGLRSPFDLNVLQKMTPGGLVKFEGGVTEVACREIPEAICQRVVEELGLRDLYAIPFVAEGEFIGTVSILTGADTINEHRRVIEAFVDQAAIALARIRLVETLLAREHEYRTLMEDAADAMFLVKPESGIVAANSKACELTGYTIEELTTLPLAVLVPPDDIPLLFEPGSDLAVGVPAIVEHRLCRKDGSLLNMETSARRLADGRYQAILRDTTERKRREEEFSRAVKSEVFEKLFVALRELHHGEGLAMNLHRIELFAKNSSVFFDSPGGGDVAAAGAPRQDAEPPGRASSRARLEDVVREYLTLGHQRLHGIATLLHAVQSDINQRVTPEEQPVLAREISSRSDQLKADLEQFLHTVQRYDNDAGNIVSDLGERIVEHVEAIFQSVSGVNRQLKNHYTSTIAEVIRPIALSLQSSYANNEISIREAAPEIKAIISPTDLAEVLSTLLVNSIEAPVRSGSTQKRILVKIRRENSRARIDVEDNGTGVALEIRDRGLGEGVTTKGPGHGYGLSYARNRLTKFGGTLTYDEQFQDGARFIIRLPLA